MEEDKLNLKLDDNKHVKRRSLIRRRDESIQEESSSNEKKKKEPEDKSSDKEDLAELSPSSQDNCAICMEKLQNKSFPDSCIHAFCFTCLVTWAKEKPECPLCKLKFNSIVHNVRSYTEYDRYFVRKSQTLSDSLWNQYNLLLTNRTVSNSYQFGIPTPSTSRATFTEFSSMSNPGWEETNTSGRLANQDDEECEIVTVLNSREEKITECIILSSDDEI